MKGPLVGLLIALAFGTAALLSWLQDRTIDWRSKPFLLGIALIMIAVFGPIVYQYLSDAELRRDLDEAQHRSKSAETVSKAAAAKAHSFQFDEPTLSAVESALSAHASARAVVGCAGNLDAVCPQLEAVFIRAGWHDVAVIRAATFWRSSTKDQHGAVVSYGPESRTLARQIADSLRAAGFDAVTRPNANITDPDLQVSLLYR